MPITDASNFVFFQLINDYLRDEINTFQWNLLTSMAQFVGAIGLILLTVWILFQGYRIVTGRTQQPMMALVGDALKATLIIGIATGAASVSSSLYWTLTDGTASAITSLVSQDSDSPYQTKSLFSKWLFYGIGTVFSLAVLSFMVGLANNVIRSVAVAFLAKYAALLAGGDGGIDGEGITSLALQQGGLGLVLTLLIVSAPSMAAAFFRGVLGQFQAYSPFGMLGRGSGGAPPSRTSEYQPALTDADYADAGRTDSLGGLRANELTFSRDMALRQAGNGPLELPTTSAIGPANSSASPANDSRVVRDFDPNNEWDPDGLVPVGADGSPIAQAERVAGPVAAADWSEQAKMLTKQSDQLANAAEWARSKGMEAEANDYQQAANRAYYDGQAALIQAISINAKSGGSTPGSSLNTSFTPNWSYMGMNSSGIPHGAAIGSFSGSIGGGLYVGVGGEVELEYSNGQIVGGKGGLGVGVGYHITRSAVSGALIQGPVYGYKPSAIAEYNPQQPGELRFGPSATAGVGIGLIGVEGSAGVGISTNNTGNRGYFQSSLNWTAAPVVPKLGVELKANLIEFAVKPQKPTYEESK